MPSATASRRSEPPEARHLDSRATTRERDETVTPMIEDGPPAEGGAGGRRPAGHTGSGLTALFIGGTGQAGAACSQPAPELGIGLSVLNRGRTSARSLPAQARLLMAD